MRYQPNLARVVVERKFYLPWSVSSSCTNSCARESLPSLVLVNKFESSFPYVRWSSGSSRVSEFRFHALGRVGAKTAKEYSNKLDSYVFHSVIGLSTRWSDFCSHWYDLTCINPLLDGQTPSFEESADWCYRPRSSSANRSLYILAGV